MMKVEGMYTRGHAALPVVALFIAIFLLTACGGLSNQQRTAASEAITSLRRVEAATQVSTSSYQEYRQFVIEAKARVNQAATTLPDGELKNELNAAMEAYEDAATAWAAMQNRAYLREDREPGMTLNTKYNLNLRGPERAAQQMSDSLEWMTNPNYESPHVRAVLGRIWAVAKTHLDRAATLHE